MQFEYKFFFRETIKLIKEFLLKFLYLKYIYRRILLISIDVILIYLSCEFVNFLFNKNIFLYKEKIILIVLAIFLYSFTGQYKSLTRYFHSSSIASILLRNTLLLFIFNLNIFQYNKINIEINETFLIWLIINIALVINRIQIKEFIKKLQFTNEKVNKVAIYGAGQAGSQLAASIKEGSNYSIKFFIDDDPQLWNRKIFNTLILPPSEILKYRNNFDTILFAIPSCGRKRRLEIFNQFKNESIKLLQVPSLEKIEKGYERIDTLRPISIEEIISRDIVMPKKSLISKCISNKVVCVTGAGGSIGNELCRQILNFNPSKLIMIENNEHSLYRIQKEISYKLPKKIKLKFYLGDTKDKRYISKILEESNINTLFHAAAYKHVGLVEENPIEGMFNNIFSTRVLCEASLKNKVSNFILISSDKAVRPSNLMGATKRVSELIVQAYNQKFQNEYKKSKENRNQIFSIVRFGNVLGSSGSVVPLFKKQIKRGGPITVTHPEVERYFMTISEAVQLVLQASNMAQGGEVFLLDMGKPIKILELAKQMIKLSGLEIKDKSNLNGDIEIIFTGLNSGEKLFEELLIDAKSQPTEHPLIFKGFEEFLSPNILWKILDELEHFLNERNLENSIQLVSKLVPEWEKSALMNK